MAQFNPTKEQQKALDANGAVLVSAAAGSGKTAVLANRVFKRVTDSQNPIDITDMLIVTFTNAAASEMRERIYTLLAEASKENPDNQRLLKQKMSVDNASICTMDSYCIDLLRENFVAAGVEPDFKIMSGEQESVMMDEAVTSAFATLASENFEAYSNLLVAMNCENIDKQAKDAVFKIYKHICSLPMPDRWLDNVCKMYDQSETNGMPMWLDYICRNIEMSSEHYLKLLNFADEWLVLNETVAANYSPLVEGLKDIYGKLVILAKQRDYDRIYSALKLRNLAKVGTSRKDSDPYIKDKVKTVVDAARAELTKLDGFFCYDFDETLADIKAAGAHVNTLVCLVRLFREKYSALKAERGYMTFADVELTALNLLCRDDNGTLKVRPEAIEIADRYKEVMVDEYQDTNDLQNAIFNALSNDGERLFLVGDVKQSIYRFRHANPMNFIKMRDSFPDYDGKTYPAKINLSGNFRSRPQICKFVNFFFDALMTREASQIDYLKTDWLDPIATGLAENSAAGVEVHLIDGGDIADESIHIANYIKTCVQNKMQVSDGKGGLRNVAYSDFLILLRSFKKNSLPIVKALKNLQIPVIAELNSEFYNRPEISLVMSLLYAVDNPLKDIPLLSAMMSNLFGFTADELAQMRIGKRKTSLYSSVIEFAANNEKAAQFVERLSKYRSWASTLPTDRLITKIYDDTGLLAVARAMDDGATRKANMLLLAEFAADYEQNGYKGLTSFLRYVDKVSKSNNDVAGGNGADSENAVRIMTVHKSKGLQAPVCIIAGMESDFNLMDARSSLVMHEQGGIGMRMCDNKLAIRYDTFARKVIGLMEQDATVAEEMRLLYVAMTRAQEKLVLVSAEENLTKAIGKVASSITENGGVSQIDPYSVQRMNGSADWLYAGILMHPDGKAAREISDAKVVYNNDCQSNITLKIIGASDIELPPTLDLQENKDLDLSAQLDYKYPYEKLLNVQSKYSVSELVHGSHADEYICTARPAFLSKEKLTPAERGTATHRFMCYADYEQAKKDISNQAEALVKQGKLTALQAEGIDREAISAFFDSALYGLMQKADRVMRESRFIFELPARDVDINCESDEKVVVQGIADCIIFENDGITVVDFKTDRNVTEEELIQRYTKQLHLYAQAFSANYNQPVKDCLIYSFWLKKVVKVPV